MAGLKLLLFLVAVLGCAVSIFEARLNAASDNVRRISSKRVKRSAIVYDVYTLDFFIELVEKIERHTQTNGASLGVIANYIRKLGGYDGDLWDQLCGESDPLPDGSLNVEEKRILTNMVKYDFDDSSRREMGVVLTPDGETVAMGHVMTGICAGLSRDKKLLLNKWTTGVTQRVDNLYAATIAYNLAQSSLSFTNGDISLLLGPSGSWSPNAECPAKYTLPRPWSRATTAEILGDIDGFLLGFDLPAWENRGVRLGQLLRMYYGSGVLYDMSYVSCKRNSTFKGLVSKDDLTYQIEGFAYAYYAKYSSTLTNVRKNDISALAEEITEKFFTYFDQTTGNAKCSTDEDDEECELPANVVFVMDESGSIKDKNYEIEKTFVRNIIEAFDISAMQARVAIVEYSTDASLSVALDNYGSKSRLLCAVSNLQYSEGYTRTAKALKLVHDNILRPAQDNPVTGTETVQVVIVLTDGKSNDPGKNTLQRTVKSLKKDIRDLTMIAVGVGDYNLGELKLIATDKKRHVFTATGFDELLDLVTSLTSKACSAPVYMGLNFTDYGDTTEVVAFVSPNKARFFTLPAEHFFGLEDIYIDVLPQYGTVSVFASRDTDTPSPDNYALKLGPAGKGEDLQIHFTDLCAGHNSSETCPPVNIGIYGEASTLSCSENDCTLPNQIKFRIRRGTPTAGSASIKGTLFIIMIQALALILFVVPTI